MPKSGSSKIRPASPPATMAIGSSEYDTSLIRCIRRSRISAVKNTHASLANSDGWNPSPPKPSQRRAPLTGALKSTATSGEPTSGKQRPDQRSFR